MSSQRNAKDVNRIYLYVHDMEFVYPVLYLNIKWERKVMASKQSL